MITSEITLELSSSSINDYSSCWVRAEQIIPSESKVGANVSDIYNLWLTAATGRSAQKLRPAACPVEFDGKIIRTFLGFYIWPSEPSMEFSVGCALGIIKNRQVVTPQREFSVFLDNQSRFALPYYMEGVSCTWETPVFNSLGEEIYGHISATVEDGIWLIFPRKLFGAIRVKGNAIGYAVVLEMTITKGLLTSNLISDKDIEKWRRGPNGEIIINTTPTEKLLADIISDLKNTVTVVWNCSGKLGSDSEDNGRATTNITEQHDVVIPQCLKDLLAFCPDPFLGLTENTVLWCDKPVTEKVYYNACTGDILGSREQSNKQSYCSRISAPPVTSSFVPSWLPKGWQR